MNLSRRRLLALPCFATGTLALTRCSPGPPFTPERPSAAPEAWLRIVTTTALLADLVRAIGGPRVRVDALLAPAVDPHRAQPSPHHEVVMLRADAVIHTGLGLEGGFVDLLETVSERVPTVAAAEAVPPELLGHDVKGAVDPHVWHDPQLWTWVVARVAETLMAVDTTSRHHRVYTLKSRLYLDRLADLDDYVAARLDRVPRERRVLASSHQAFSYLAARFGWQTESLQGLTPLDSPGVSDIAATLERLIATGTDVVFAEVSQPLAPLMSLISLAESRAVSLRLGGPLHADTLATGHMTASRLLGMSRVNVDRIVAELA